MRAGWELIRVLVMVPIVVASGCWGSREPAVARSPTPAPEADEPTRRAVHIDTLAPDKVEQFVAARLAWIAELGRANATDGRGVFVQVGDHQMYTIRSFTRFADFDTRGAAIEQSLAAVPKAAGETYDRGADSALVFPHTSEIWELDPALSYLPATGALTEATAAVGNLVIDDTRPDPTARDHYWDATAAQNKVLAAAHYPLTRLGFRTTFGAGHVITLWLAPSQAVLDATPTVDAVIGGTRAVELQAEIAGAVVRREVLPVVIRHDLTQPQE